MGTVPFHKLRRSSLEEGEEEGEEVCWCENHKAQLSISVQELGFLASNMPLGRLIIDILINHLG